MSGGPTIRRVDDPAVSWSDGPDAFADACSARGITPLPDPEIDFPDWLAEERSSRLGP